jgi:hypothetical protein
MKTKIVLFFEVALAVGFLTATSVQAVPTTYQYTGNPFTDVTAPYTTSDFVTATLTLAGPLAPNMPLTSVTPIAFTLSDGVQTITNLTPGLFNAAFSVETGGAGQIRFWIMEVTFGGHGIGPYIVSDGTGDPDNTFDAGSDDTFHESYGVNNGAPGRWATVGGVADTGSTLSLMTLTLMALAVAARQFNRAAA